MSNFSQTPFFRHILAMDTSTDQLSLAVATTHGSVDAATWDVWAFSGESGAKASAGMVAAIQALLADAGIALSQVDAIAFGQGPGAFTGLRTACAVTQGLAASLRPGGVPVIPVNTLLAVAQAARLAAAARGDVSATALAGPWTAVMDARMGEVYVARYVFTSALTPTAVPACTQAPVLLTPTALKPSGSRITRSPWLIQTWWRSPGDQTPSNSVLLPVTSAKARPNSRWLELSTSPPSCATIVICP